MITEEKALELLETNAPISKSKMSDRYLFVVMRSEGQDNEEIAEELNMDLMEINDVELDIEEEFLK